MGLRLGGRTWGCGGTGCWVPLFEAQQPHLVVGQGPEGTPVSDKSDQHSSERKWSQHGEQARGETAGSRPQAPSLPRTSGGSWLWESCRVKGTCDFFGRKQSGEKKNHLQCWTKGMASFSKIEI